MAEKWPDTELHRLIYYVHALALLMSMYIYTPYVLKKTKDAITVAYTERRLVPYPGHSSVRDPGRQAASRRLNELPQLYERWGEG